MVSFVKGHLVSLAIQRCTLDRTFQCRLGWPLLTLARCRYDLCVQYALDHIFRAVDCETVSPLVGSIFGRTSSWRTTEAAAYGTHATTRDTRKIPAGDARRRPRHQHRPWHIAAQDPPGERHDVRKKLPGMIFPFPSTSSRSSCRILSSASHCSTASHSCSRSSREYRLASLRRRRRSPRFIR